jgi:hypothetical protein
VLPYDQVWHRPNLLVLRLGVVPQCDRCPRLVVDYILLGVNEDMLLLAPKEAMQSGRMLQRVMSTTVRADPRY